MPDHLVGAPIPHTYLEEGRQVYNTDNGILNCNIALLEEFSDGPVALARSLMRPLMVPDALPVLPG